MKKLKIAQIAGLNIPVPPPKYGGSEKVIYWISEELVRRGHEVYLFATANSKTSGHLVPIVEKGLWDIKPDDDLAYYATEMAIVGQYMQQEQFDIVHDHIGPWSLALYGQSATPIVHTLHVPFEQNRIWAYKKLNAKLISISHAQRKPAPDLNYIANIYHGIDVENFPFRDSSGEYFLWVGELSERKGAVQAIEVAKKADIPLLMIGRIPTTHTIYQKRDYEFFQRHIEPELNKGNIIYGGEKTPEELKSIYEKASALLFPLQWEEPFGLIYIEAMACGTPVITFNRGSAPEVIKDGVTGYVVDTVDEMVDAIKKVDQIDRKACREWVEQNFTIQKMVDSYEKTFQEILSKR